MDLGQASLGEGRIALPVAGLQVPPYLEIRDDELYWAWVEPGTIKGELSFDRYGASPDGLLDEFLKIKDGSGVLRFAERYGPLGLCEHGLPASHNAPAMPKPYLPYTGCLPRSVDTRPFQPPIAWWFVFRESVEEWLSFVEQAGTLLALAEMVKWGKRPTEDDIAPILTMFLNAPIASVKQTVAGVLNWWLFAGGAGTAITWEEDRPMLALRSTPLPQIPQAFGVLAHQLMMVAAGAKRLMICGCGEPFIRKNDNQDYCTPGCRSRTNQRRYDATEGAKAKKRAKA